MLVLYSAIVTGNLHKLKRNGTNKPDTTLKSTALGYLCFSTLLPVVWDEKLLVKYQLTIDGVTI